MLFILNSGTWFACQNASHSKLQSSIPRNQSFTISQQKVLVGFALQSSTPSSPSPNPTAPTPNPKPATPTPGPTAPAIPNAPQRPESASTAPDATPNPPGTAGVSPTIDPSLKPSTSTPPAGSTPLVLDLNRDHRVDTLFAQSGLRKKVAFDINSTGHPVLLEWISPSDGFLVYDQDNDGLISSGRELFGNATQANGFRYFSNGFLALQSFDADGNRSINHNDPIFSQLKIWVDANSNGLSETNELQPLTKYSIISINLNYVDLIKPKILKHSGSYIGQISSVQTHHGPMAIFDVYFRELKKPSHLSLLNVD